MLLIHKIIEGPYDDPKSGVLSMDVYSEDEDGFFDSTLTADSLDHFWPIIKHMKSSTIEPYQLDKE